MAKGIVKWFSNQKGYGFITPENSDKDIFVHFSSVMADGFKTLKQGDEVEFEIKDGPKGEQAVDVKPRGGGSGSGGASGKSGKSRNFDRHE